MSQPVVSHNIFSALAKPKKSKSGKTKKEKPAPEIPDVSHEELDKVVFSAPNVGVTNWADDTDEEDAFVPTPSNGLDAEGWSEVRGTPVACHGECKRVWMRARDLGCARPSAV